jgi:hypothetical protein
MTPDHLRGRAQALRSQLPPRRQATPPPEHGKRLATISRSADEAIHINWCEYEGHPYLSVRFWRRGDDGQFWPDRHRGFSIRLRELPDIAAAIAEALDLAEAHLGSRPEHQPQRRAGGDRRTWHPSQLPMPTGVEPGPAFDEFVEGSGQ